MKKARNDDDNETSSISVSPDVRDDFLPYTTSTQTGKALVATLAIACLRLNSTRVVDLQLMQIVFARVYFFNRAKLMPLPILCKNSITDLSPQAKGYLHGRRILDLLSPSQEAFIRFVVLVDLMRYHGVILRNYSNAAHGFSDPDDNNALVEFMANYKGPKNMTLPFYDCFWSRHTLLIKKFSTCKICTNAT